MATKKKAVTAVTLEKLVPLYGRDKAILDEYKKSTDLANKRIKELMAEKGLEDYTSEGYKAVYSVSESKSYNMEALLEYMHKHEEFAPCIKTQEYVDEDVLENLIYNGKIAKTKVAELAKFRVIKKSPRLTVKKVEED